GSHARIVIRDKVRAFVAKNEPWLSPGIDNACRRFGHEMAVAQALETPNRLHEAETIIAQALTCGVDGDHAEWMLKAIAFLNLRSQIPAKTRAHICQRDKLNPGLCAECG